MGDGAYIGLFLDIHEKTRSIHGCRPRNVRIPSFSVLLQLSWKLVCVVFRHPSIPLASQQTKLSSSLHCSKRMVTHSKFERLSDKTAMDPIQRISSYSVQIWRARLALGEGKAIH